MLLATGSLVHYGISDVAGRLNIAVQTGAFVSHRFRLISVDEDIFEVDKLLNAHTTSVRQFGNEWSVRLQQLRGGLSQGVDVLHLDNGCLRLAILPTRGMGIWKGSVAGVPLEWKSPVGRPVHPSFVDPMRRGGIGWLDGFNEVICRCGLGWHGAPGTDVIRDADGNVVSEQFLPLHGRIANLPAHEVSVSLSDDGELLVVGQVDEASMFGGRLRLTSTLSTYIGSNTFEITDVVTNLSASPADVEMLYHCNFGPPFLGKGATFHTAVEEVAPRDNRAAKDVSSWQNYEGPETGYAEQVYFMRPIADEKGRGTALLRSPCGDKAVCLHFDTENLPWFSLWKNTQAEADGYVTGLEPGSSFPNLRMFERSQGRVISLPADKSVMFQFSVTGLVHADDVEAEVKAIEQLQSGHKPKMRETPHPDWSPGAE